MKNCTVTYSGMPAWNTSGQSESRHWIELLYLDALDTLAKDGLP